RMKGVWIAFLLFFSVAHSDPCPMHYALAPNGGDCYQCKTFFDSFSGNYYPKSFDQAETECNQDGGGMLTSIHSAEEWETMLRTAYCNPTASGMWWNIGLKCKGKDCKWDDGTPVDYTNFADWSVPKDEDAFGCYGIAGTDGAWQRRGAEYHEETCGQQPHDGWMCRVKARTIDCVDGETEYKGGCASVQTSPLDQKTAEASCPGGGTLVSIHSNNENEFYQKLALNAGVSRSIYIGGQFSNGVFEWTDGSYLNTNKWANSFPNTVFGTCVQMLLASEFGVVGQWTNIDCTVKQAYICFRDGTSHDPTAIPLHPKADAHCPPVQYYTGSGNIFSPNYPLSITRQQSCEYVVGTHEGTRASIKFPTYDCQSGTYLALFDGMNSDQPFMTFTTDSPTLNQSYNANSNVLKIVFTTNGTAAPIGTGWEADFTGI
ncbi:hypothetical protein PENTCL1PPCAC_3676, partial [Pristionchus entomophagus]